MGELKDRVDDAERERYDLKVDDLRDEVGRLRKLVASLLKTQDTLERVAAAAARPLQPPKWLKPKRKRGEGNVGIPVAFLSDMHFDEVVDPAEVRGLNAYNREIAEQRLETFFSHIVMLTREYLTGYRAEGIVVPYGGDGISGDIHDLTETNEGTTLETVVYWTERLAAGLGYLADEFGSVYVPATVGNHPRRTFRERTKKRVRDNFDWLIAQMLARHFKDDARVTFDIPDSVDVPFQVYDHRFLLNHGQAGGGQGIGGIWPPIMRLKAKTSELYPFDTMILGHWHQYIHASGQGLIVNGSLKGYDEYAMTMKFRPERPQQALWVVTPEHGVTFAAPLIVSDRKKEGW